MLLIYLFRMVNRKSRNANFLQNGSLKSKMVEQIKKEKVENNHPKENKRKRTRKNPITLDDAKEFFENLEYLRNKKNKKPFKRL